MKFAIMLDLIFLSILFMLVMCAFEEAINLDLLSLFIEIIICFLEGSLVVILILGLAFPKSLIVLWIFLIFLADRLGKFSLSFKILPIFRANSWAYNCLVLGLAVFFTVLPFLLKNFYFSKVSLDSLARIGGKSLTTSTCLFFNCSILLTGLLMLLLGKNLDDIFCLNILLFSLVPSTFHPAL